MTPTFCCGFECGQLGAGVGGVGQHWSSTGGAVSFDTTIKRNGARSLRINPSAAVAYANSLFLGGTAVKVARAAIRFDTLPGADCDIFAFSGYGARFQQSDSKIYAATGGVEGSTGVSVTIGVWYVIDIRADGTGSTVLVDVKVNGTACAQRGQVGGGPTNFDQVRCGSLATITSDIYFDDIVISTNAADYPIGDGYVNHFVPTADGTHNISGAADFRRGDTTTDILNSTTTAYELVDEVPLDDTTPDADDHIRIVAPAAATDYVECKFGPAPGISTPTVAPRAVEVITEVFAAGTGLADEQIKVNDNGTVDTLYNGTGIAGIVTGTYKRKHYPLAPTGGAWAVAAGAGDFNNLRLRYGYSTDANPDKSLMCAMVEAEFAALATGRRRINVT